MLLREERHNTRQPGACLKVIPQPGSIARESMCQTGRARGDVSWMLVIINQYEVLTRRSACC